MSIEQSEEDKFLSIEKTITKAHLADYLFEKVGLNKREAKEFVESRTDHAGYTRSKSE